MSYSNHRDEADYEAYCGMLRGDDSDPDFAYDDAINWPRGYLMTIDQAMHAFDQTNASVPMPTGWRHRIRHHEGETFETFIERNNIRLFQEVVR